MNGIFKLILVCWIANVVMLAPLAQPTTPALRLGCNMPTSMSIAKRSGRTGESYDSLTPHQKKSLQGLLTTADLMGGRAHEHIEALENFLRAAGVSKEELQELQKYDKTTATSFGKAACKIDRFNALVKRLTEYLSSVDPHIDNQSIIAQAHATLKSFGVPVPNVPSQSLQSGSSGKTGSSSGSSSGRKH